MRRSYLRDMAPTEEELQAAKTAGSAAQNGTAWGSGIGTALGAGLGALASIPSFGTLAPILIPAGMGVGGGLGAAAGGAIGGAQADDAEKKLESAEAERQKKIEDEQLYQEALNRLYESG